MKMPINWANQAQRNAGLVLTREDVARNAENSAVAIGSAAASKAVDGDLSADAAVAVIGDASVRLARAVERARVEALRLESLPTLPDGWVFNRHSGEVGPLGTRWSMTAFASLVRDADRAKAVHSAMMVLGHGHPHRPCPKAAATIRQAVEDDVLGFSDDDEVRDMQMRDYARLVG